MKYFDINTPNKKMNAWEKSLLELERMIHGADKDNDTNTKVSKKKVSTRS